MEVRPHVVYCCFQLLVIAKVSHLIKLLILLSKFQYCLKFTVSVHNKSCFSIVFRFWSVVKSCKTENWQSLYFLSNDSSLYCFLLNMLFFNRFSFVFWNFKLMKKTVRWKHSITKNRFHIAHYILEIAQFFPLNF